jgi:hypothetical protein
MDASLSIAEIEHLVAERARKADRAFAPGQIHVFEDPHSTDGRTLIVQVSAKRPDDLKDWTRLRLRFSQSVRDALVERGDDRYPLIEVFEPEEWAGRNG